MVDMTVVQLPRLRPDQGLVSALEKLVVEAKQGKIDRMVCVCMGPNEFTRYIRYRDNSLALMGAMNVLLSALEETWYPTN